MSGTLSNLRQRLCNRSKAVGADNLTRGLQDAEIQGQRPTCTANKLVFLDPSAEEFDLEDLLRGNAEHLGEGTIGMSFTVVLEGWKTVVVKRLRDVAIPEGEFRKTMNGLGVMRHENLLPLRAYYYSGDEQFLLFDYAPQRSLDGLLLGGIGTGKTPLSWEIGCRIALGAARAMEYLHAQGPNVFHGNIKSTNVLLTASYDPLVSDYGLTHFQVPPKGKPANPQKEDVYSFGVLLVELLTGKIPDGADLSISNDRLVNFTTGYYAYPASFFDLKKGYCPHWEELVGLLQVALACASGLPASMSEVRRMIEDLVPQPRPNQIIKVNCDFSKRIWNLPSGGVLEVSDRVYVFDYCLTMDWSLFGQIENAWLKHDMYKLYMKGIVAKLHDQFPAASFMVINFGEPENQSKMAKVLSEYGMTVMELPRNYGGCPIPRLEIILNLLRSADEWLSSDTKRHVVLMHCERGAWPVLAFMLASLLIYREKLNGEKKTLDMTYKKGVHGRKLLQLISKQNPLASQLRYLHYVSTWNAGSDWPPPDKVLVIKSVILTFNSQLDAEGGCRPIVKITGREPFMVADQAPKVLFSTARRSEYVRQYKWQDGEKVKLDIHCNVQGDVVLECLNLDADLVHEESMFRAMFNTAFISNNVLKLKFDDMDVLWDRQDQYPKEFLAEIVFSQGDAATSLVMVDLSSNEEENKNQIEKSMRKIEPEELPAERRAVHSVTLSYDAYTSPGENEVPELPVQFNTELTSTLPPTPPLLSETSVHSALEGSFGCFEVATKSPYISPSFGLDRQYGNAVEGNGENAESLKWEEGTAAVTKTNMEVTSVSDSASSSAVNNSSVEAMAAGVSNSAQITDMMLPKQEILHQQDGSPSSTFMSSGYDYDVFLSFRGPDTRSGITDFLYTSFLAAGIRTFKDDEDLRVGEEIGPELVKAISHSKIAIPIFSKGYALSKWCLDELIQMVKCSKTRRQKIIPLFYDVTPTEVRHQTGSYGDAFLLHEKKFAENNIMKWKAALKDVSNLKGWYIDLTITRREGEVVRTIVQKVVNELKTAYLLVTDYLVGVHNHMKEINTMMCANSGDIRILGIHGMGGVGKTTLAKIIYNQLLYHFEDCCFLSNIRETSELKGIECLQKQLISNVLKSKWSNISNVDEGVKTIKERLGGKKVLVLLDDVDTRTHLNALIGKAAWFGLGSRIIITSRNRDIIDALEVCYAYELKGMNFNQSLELFSKHAFGRDYPLDDYVAFSTEVVKITGGLPLALEAIGSQLSRKSKDVWDMILKKLKQVPHEEVRRKLKISYDALDDWQKYIFLDIACLFTGFDKRIVLHMWNNSNLFPEEGLEVLQKMSLIKIGEDNKLWMHDQLRDLGRDIVRRECNMELEKQTRLWNHEEALDVLIKKKGTKKVEALCLKFDHQLQSYFANKEFERLSNLRYLEVRVVQDNWPSNDFPDNLQNSTPMLSKLRWLSWHHFPVELKLTNFSMMNIVILDLSWSKLSESWDGWSYIKTAENLKVLNLTGCVHLHRTPDFSANVKLEHLILENCGRMVQIDKSIGHLKQLVILNLRYCPKLHKLPEEMDSLEALEELLLDGTSIREIPEWKGMKKLETLSACDCPSLNNCRSIGNLTSLQNLSMEHAPISQIPQEIGVLQKLKHLSLSKCKLLKGLPNSIGKLESLLTLNLSHTHIAELPNSFGNLKNLKVLRMSSSSIRILPGTIKSLEKLEEIDAEFCLRLEGAIPHGIESLLNLRILKLTNTSICQVPRLPESLIGLHISTHSMKTLPDLSNLVNLIDLDLDIGQVPLAREDSIFIESSQFLRHPSPGWIGKLCNLESLKLSCEIIIALHENIRLLLQLKKLELVCSNLQSLPRLPSSLTCLLIKSSQSLETPIDLLNLKELSELRIVSSATTSVQGLGGLKNLEILDLRALNTLERLPDLSNLKKLNELHLEDCHNLSDIQSIEGMENLRILKLIEIPLVERLPNLSNLKKLIELHLWSCHGLLEIKSLEGLENLTMLKLGELPLLERLPNLSNLKKLTKLDVRQCYYLVKIEGRLESLEDLCIEGCRSLDEVLDPSSSFKKLKSLRIHDCEKLHLDRMWVPKFEISDRTYENSTCSIQCKIGICVCQLGKQFFLPSLPK